MGVSNIYMCIMIRRIHYLQVILHVLIYIPALFYITLYTTFFVYRRSFYRLDPRWQILTFFNDLALEGMDNLEQSDGIISETKVSTT